jgi:hypothetical protein
MKRYNEYEEKSVKMHDYTIVEPSVPKCARDRVSRLFTDDESFDMDHFFGGQFRSGDGKIIGHSNCVYIIVDTKSKSTRTSCLSRLSLMPAYEDDEHSFHNLILTTDHKYIITQACSLTTEDLEKDLFEEGSRILSVFAVTGKVVSHVLLTAHGPIRTILSNIDLTPDQDHLICTSSDSTTHIARIKDLVTEGDKCADYIPWITIPIVCEHVLLSVDATRIAIIGTDRNVWIIDLDRFEVVSTTTAPEDVELDDLSFSLDGTRIVLKIQAVEAYRRRCVKYAHALLRTCGSVFANRTKMSVWDVPDVFADAVICPHFGMTKAHALRIIGTEMSVDGLGEALSKYCGLE